MADHEDENFKMALRMSMQLETPELKRSKPWENSVIEGPPKEDPEIMKRRAQRNLMAAAAEKRMMSAMNNPVPTEKKVEKDIVFKQGSSDMQMQTVSDDSENNYLNIGLQLSPDEASQPFSIVFGGDVRKGILTQWSNNQGIRFSPDRETSMALVQHEGGPCGVLAAFQECIQVERYDPSQPLVFTPFGHASQEIVNLLLCGEAVAHSSVVQDENEFERRESQIRRAFDARDQSGGGGFINVEKMDCLCNSGYIVWSEFWQKLLDLDNSLGGLKDTTGLNGKKVFNVYYFNCIDKAVLSYEVLIQKPRYTNVRVLVPPKWTPEEFMSLTPPQHAQLVDCIRTRWPRGCRICPSLGLIDLLVSL